ncbi:MAG: rod shape-determining protein MreD [Bacteroidota bacterium]
MNKNSIIFTNGVRFLLLVFIQVFILRQMVIAEGFWNYFKFFIYPLFIFLLPFNFSKYLVIVLGFFTGLTVDMFYDTLGVHAAAGTFTGYMRSRVLKWLEPKGGYNVNFSPTKSRMGNSWFFPYVSILLLCHVFAYFCAEQFNVAKILDIIIGTVASFVASFSAIMVIQVIFNPKQ